MVHEKQSTTYLIIYPLTCTNNNCNSVLLCSNFSNHFPLFLVTEQMKVLTFTKRNVNYIQIMTMTMKLTLFRHIFIIYKIYFY